MTDDSAKRMLSTGLNKSGVNMRGILDDILKSGMNVPPASVEFMLRLLVGVPELRPVYEEHMVANDHVLPHVLMGSVSWYVQDLLRSNGASEENVLRRLLDLLEQGLALGDAAVRDVILASFVENVVKEQSGHELDRLRSMVGPNLLEALEVELGS